MALGARLEQVVGMVTWQGLRVALAGLVAGMLTALCLARFLDPLLFSVSSGDAMNVLLTALILLTATVVASYFPARRAASFDPAVEFRRL